MPNCFRLYRKPVTPDTQPAILQDVDAAICAHFGKPVHPTYWANDWYHVIGFLIACKNDCALGSTNLRNEVAKWYDYGPTDAFRIDHMTNQLRILDYLEAHYTSDSWAEIGRR